MSPGSGRDEGGGVPLPFAVFVFCGLSPRRPGSVGGCCGAFGSNGPELKVWNAC